MSKLFIAIIANFICFQSFSQINKINTLDSSSWPPKLFINSVLTSTIKYINVSNVQSTEIARGEKSFVDYKNHTSGAIYIKLKNPDGVVSLQDLISQKNLKKSDQFIFVINDDVLLDTVNVRIDKDAITEINVISSSDINYLKHHTSSVVFNIKLLWKTPPPPDPKSIRIH